MKKSVVAVLVGSISVPLIALAGSGSHWGYEGHEGPEHWGDLAKEFATCKTGKTQSPIDIDFGVLKKGDVSEIKFSYADVIPEILNNGHTIQVNYGAGSSIEVNGQKFDLLQFHFHTPSENTVKGKAFPMEVHFVHKNDKGELAVVGVMFKEGAHNAELQKAWDKMPAKGGEKAVLSGVSINAKNMLPGGKTFSHFKGSLTTPPCSEGVNWFVMKDAIEASAEQIAQFHKVVGDNARPVQPLNGRKVVLN